MGDINFHCRSCGRSLVIDAAGAGFEVRCPDCGTAQTVPVPSTEPTSGAPPTESRAPDPSPPIAAVPEFAQRETTGGEEFRYEAFISYRHVEPDRKWARWLHTALETYRVPKKLVRERKLPRRLTRVFRDEEELPASADLSEEIERALQQSRFLIVICSPETPTSRWVRGCAKLK